MLNPPAIALILLIAVCIIGVLAEAETAPGKENSIREVPAPGVVMAMAQKDMALPEEVTEALVAVMTVSVIHRNNAVS